jgi:hypothetical protein
MKAWLGPIFCILFLCPWILGNSECNAFLGTADKAGDDALSFTARQQMNTGDYTGSLTTIGKMTSARQSSHDGLILYASAYAGRCGLNLAYLADDLANMISTKPIMAILMSNLKATNSYADCVLAEAKIQAIPVVELTPDDYLFYAFLEFTKIGVTLEINADKVDHDGVTDASFNPCSTASIGNADVDMVAGSLNLAMSALSASGSQSVSNASSAYQTLCSAGYPCAKTTGFTANEHGAIRTIINANEVGLNKCGGPSSNLILCGCGPT